MEVASGWFGQTRTRILVQSLQAQADLYQTGSYGEADLKTWIGKRATFDTSPGMVDTRPAAGGISWVEIGPQQALHPHRVATQAKPARWF